MIKKEREKNMYMTTSLDMQNAKELKNYKTLSKISNELGTKDQGKDLMQHNIYELNKDLRDSTDKKNIAKNNNAPMEEKYALIDKCCKLQDMLLEETDNYVEMYQNEQNIQQ